MCDAASHKEDIAAEIFSRNKWKQAAKNKENYKNFLHHLIYKVCLHWSMSKVSFGSLENTPTE